MIKSVCICGAGTMGSGIAQTMAHSGYYAILYDVDEAALSGAGERINGNLSHLVSKQIITEQDASDIPKRITFTSNLNDCIADLIIEAIAEDVSMKIGLFSQLTEINHSETIFTSNTSSISLTTIAESVPYPERIAGLHFFNPAPVMKLVELAQTTYTSQHVTDQLLTVIQTLGKTAVVCKDSPGFIVNRVARPFYLEALTLAEQNAASITDIDTLTESVGFRMGPFRLMDLIGNDINCAVSQSLYEAFNKPDRLQPSSMQLQKVQLGELGKKTGKGYYDYPANS